MILRALVLRYLVYVTYQVGIRGVDAYRGGIWIVYTYRCGTWVGGTYRVGTWLVETCIFGIFLNGHFPASFFFIFVFSIHS